VKYRVPRSSDDGIPTTRMKILLVSSMFPGSREPDYGIFVKQIADELERLGHDLRYVVSDRRAGSPGKHVGLAAAALTAARSFRPDVVYAHYLVPAGAVASVAARVARAPLVLTAHGRDVRNVGSVRGVESATRYAVTRSSRVIAVSDFLRRELVARIPEAEGRVDVIDCGVDLERFRNRDATEARRLVRWEGEPPFFLCVGSLDARKNVTGLAEAFQRLGEGSLAFAGDGPKRGELEGRQGVRVVGRVPHESVADWIAACDVLCQPSLVEPFGQAILEAMASERSVVATSVGGPPEFVTPEAGVLVDPADLDAIEAGLRTAAARPHPNPAAREAAAEHDVRRQAERISAVLEAAAQ
jgi:glycosyltransferase involved in cell wall biosynthesis